MALCKRGTNETERGMDEVQEGAVQEIEGIVDTSIRHKAQGSTQSRTQEAGGRRKVNCCMRTVRVAD